MKKYELTELDIEVLIGVASAYVVKQHPQRYPMQMEDLLVEFAAKIAVAVSDHLSGKKTLPEDAIQYAKRAQEALSRMFDSLT